ncbi:MAG TPA: fumarate hydratase [Candidatus Eremiobacteraeota bacterium]|nr:MAG: L(+)-tartrate dehydratase subunit alpha [bacterium ADurb.Bin363]HPZ07847.1 fumarate hydratase [Candidatus Eremiobacteraeota bacterium]
MDLTNHFEKLITLTSTQLPSDVEDKLRKQMAMEEEGTPAKASLKTIIQNIEMARKETLPICQDTGALIFYINYPSEKYRESDFREAILKATRIVTGKSLLRPNAVDGISGKNSGDNTGAGSPWFNFYQWDRDYVEVKLLLKGGGSENCGIQYKLPDDTMGAGRNLQGVKKCVIDAVFRAQGEGCAPGIIGVCIGGNRDSGNKIAKEMLFRKLDDINPEPKLAEAETDLYNKLNSLNIGPMGLGGKTTVLGVKIGALHRLPACYFVSISYMCWACRRHTMIIKGEEITYD